MVDGGAELHALVVPAADEPAVLGDEGGADLVMMMGGSVSYLSPGVGIWKFIPVVMMHGSEW